MNDNEKRKSPEELTDEALDAVTGGGRIVFPGNCAKCNDFTSVELYHNPANRAEGMLLCDNCARDTDWVK